MKDVDVPAWSAYVEECAHGFPHRSLPLIIEAARSDTGVVERLLDALDSGQDAALLPLREILRRGILAAKSLTASRFLSRVSQVCHEGYPASSRSWPYFTAWRFVDPKGARAFVMDGVEPSDEWDEEAARAFVLDLSTFSIGEGAKLRLESLPLLPGRAEDERRRVLEGMRPLSEAEVRDLGRRWRRSRSPEVLAEIYHRYLAAIPLRTVKMTELLEILGRPDIGDEREARYQPSAGTAMYLCADEDGYLGSRSLS